MRESVVAALEIGSLLFARRYEELEPSTSMYAPALRDLENLCAAAVGAFAFARWTRTAYALQDPRYSAEPRDHSCRRLRFSLRAGAQVCAAAESNSPKKKPE